MNKTEEAAAALERRLTADADVEVAARPRKATLVQSVRMSRELTERLFAEAARRGTTPSQVIRDLVEAGLTAAETSAVVRVVDVQRAVDELAQRRSA